jgi:hypothetical protein
MLQETFTFSTLEPANAHRIASETGFTNWTLEVDYPHMESLWPRSQEVFSRELQGADDDFIEDITWKRLSDLYSFPIMDAVYA